MSFVYLIAAHERPDQLAALLDRLLPPGTPDRVVLHLDRRSAMWREQRGHFAAHPSGRVELIARPVAVRWGHRSQLAATRLMLEAVLRRPFTLAHHLSGTDWPVVPRARIAAEATASPEAVWATVLGHEQEERMQRWWLDAGALAAHCHPAWREQVERTTGRLQRRAHCWADRFVGARTRPIGAWNKGWSWWSVPPDAARALVSGIAALEACGRLRGTTCSDEHVSATILHREFGERLAGYRRYVRWPEEAWSPVFLSPDERAAIAASDAWFARKIDAAAEPGWLDAVPAFG